MFGFSLGEILVVAMVALIVFGPEKLPEIARTVGGLMSQFKKGADSFKKDFYNSVYKPLDDASIDVRRNLKSISLPTAKEILADSAKTLVSAPSSPLPPHSAELPLPVAAQVSTETHTAQAAGPADAQADAPATASPIYIEPVQIHAADSDFDADAQAGSLPANPLDRKNNVSEGSKNISSQSASHKMASEIAPKDQSSDDTSKKPV